MANNRSNSIFNDNPLSWTQRNVPVPQSTSQGYEDDVRGHIAATEWQNSSPVPVGVQQVMPVPPNANAPIPTFDPSNLFKGGGE